MIMHWYNECVCNMYMQIHTQNCRYTSVFFFLARFGNKIIFFFPVISQDAVIWLVHCAVSHV